MSKNTRKKQVSRRNEKAYEGILKAKYAFYYYFTECRTYF